MQYPKSRRDLSDPIERGKAPAHERLLWACEQAVKSFGRDPRAGGFQFVAQPELIEHVVAELPEDKKQLQRMVVVGTTDSDVVAWWICDQSSAKVPLRVSRRAREPEVMQPDGKVRPMPNLWPVPDHLMRESTQADRAAAAEIRMRLWREKIIN